MRLQLDNLVVAGGSSPFMGGVVILPFLLIACLVMTYVLVHLEKKCKTTEGSKRRLYRTLFVLNILGLVTTAIWTVMSLVEMIRGMGRI